MYATSVSAPRRNTDRLTSLHASAVGKIDDLTCAGRRPDRGGDWHASRFHVVLPIAGAFVWHVGGEAVFADANQALFVEAGGTSSFSHPRGGERSMVLTPGTETLNELFREKAALVRPRGHGGTRHFMTSYAVQLAVHELRWTAMNAEPIAVDEHLIDTMHGLILHAPALAPFAGANTRRILERAKAYLHAYSTAPISLSAVAAACGVTPVYLTQLFRRSEGLPLYQYLLKLRLSAALVALPTCEDITDLSLALGFSSHSHFTATFRARFGVTPSTCRERGRSFGVDRATAGARSIVTSLNRQRALPVQPLCVARGGVDWDEPSFRTERSAAEHSKESMEARR